MNETNWIPLADYSNKHKVSISTLRRRIKAETIQYRFESGKYFILDVPIPTHQTPHRPSQLRAQDQSWTPQHETRDGSEEQTRSQNTEESRSSVEEPVLTTAQALLAEIKKAYRQILQEKEEQIMQLKDQLNDMRTLIKVLENENDRLNERPIKPMDI